jgi:CubicO group peptidase (beta-lactamase class C family)
VGHVAGTAVDRSTIFYGASVTKQMIGLLLAQLIASGRASADDPVLRWVVQLPAWTSPVLLRHLAHHTSDLPDLADPALGVPRSNGDVIARFHELHSPRPFDPGSTYRYNNSGYVLLAEAVGRAAGQPIAHVASARLFRPLALSHARLGGRPVRVAGAPDPPGTIGDGGLWTSVEDLIGWLRGNNDAGLGQAAQRLAETPAGPSNSYARGVRVTSAGPYRLITHGGTWYRWFAKTVRVPERQVAVAVLSLGGSEAKVSTMGNDLARALVSG